MWRGHCPAARCPLSRRSATASACALMTLHRLKTRIESASRCRLSFSRTTCIAACPRRSSTRFFNACAHVVVLDYLENRTTAQAELVLPAATFAEADGTLVSSEGRAQRFFPVFPPSETVRQSWRWLGEWETLDQVIADLCRKVPDLAARGASRPFGCVSYGRGENSARTAPLQRTHGSARQHQRERTEASRGSRFSSVVLDGRKSGPAAVCSDSFLLVPRLELYTVDQ